MTSLLRKALACVTTAASLTGLCATSAQAAPATVLGGFWAYDCPYGRACVETLTTDALDTWVFDGCGYHDIYANVTWGIAHGNKFRITYEDGRWDEVAAWTDRPLDKTNPTDYAYVYC